MTKLVYDFSEGGREMKDLLGGKGANLAEMTGLGLPVPPGFVITTEACRAYRESGDLPTELAAGGRRAPVGPRGAHGQAARRPRRPAAGQRALRREVLDAGDDGHRPEHRPERRQRARGWPSRRAASASPGTPTGACCRCSARPCSRSRASSMRSTPPSKAKGVRSDLDLDEADLRELVDRFKALVQETTGEPFPQDPRVQLELAVRAVFDSWDGERAVLYRRQERIPADLGTAVNVCSDGLRQPRHGLRHRRRLHPRPEQRRAGRLRRLPAERAGRGRRRRHPQHRPARRPRGTRRDVVRPADADDGHVWSSTTATCATSSSPSSAASCGCCRPASASAPQARRSASRRSSSTRG